MELGLGLELGIGLALGIGLGLGLGLGLAEERSLRGRQREPRAARQGVHDEVEPL